MSLELDIDSTQQPGSMDSEGSGAVLIENIMAKVAARLEERFHAPTATYRLQFNRFFTFKQARDLVPYFKRLGISDLYASPYFRARAESLHGYDIASHNELNPSIGSEEDLSALTGELHRHGMYHILDTVPNHMGIGEMGNVWWIDVLENGRSSIYAPYFDIDWDPINTKLTGKVLLPVLGEQYGKVLENGELRVEFAAGEGVFRLRYHEHTFPLNPRSYMDILSIDLDEFIRDAGPESNSALEYQSILTALDHLPPHYTGEYERVLERNREKEVIKRRIAALASADPAVLEQIERNLAQINGTPGDPHSFDRLDALLEKQAYRLSFWRVATEEINYRRFFDVNDLAAIRVELPEVFAETHRMIMRFLREGKLNGLRIDHVDGLRDPAGYFRNLQRAYILTFAEDVLDEVLSDHGGPERAEVQAQLAALVDERRVADPKGLLYRPLYVAVEKILARGETLPADWAVWGTTGYEYTNLVNGLFVDSANAKAFDEIYAAFTGEQVNFTDMVYESKRQIMRVSLSSEVNVLTNMLNHISERDRHYRDFTLNSIRFAIREVVACFPVYRTYITPEHTAPDRRDAAYIETAVARARKRNPATDPSIFDFIRDILLLKGFDGLPEDERAARFDFVMKFQQVTGPVIAKGLEDTAFYVYNRLVSLNEVGGEPEYFGTSPDAFHKAQVERLRNWPYSLLTTSTHDTKRSEDVRARINVLSEIPREWRTAVRRWARVNRKFKRMVDGQAAPDRNEEYFLYQTLIGIWPFEQELTEETHTELVERLKAYMRKALSEAKVHTSWVNPNEPYQQAVAEFIETILRRDEDNRFLLDLLTLQRYVAHYGVFNSLSQVLLKITSPGVPDIYQGNEIWDLSLVDPDNRRPVDYRARRRLLDRVEKVRDARGASALLASPADGRIKLLVTARALNFRDLNRDLFARGDYKPLAAAGKYAGNIVAYERSYESKSVLVVAPRLLTKLARSGETANPVGPAWGDTRLVLSGTEKDFAPGTRFRNVFTGEEIEAQELEGGVGLALESVLSSLPVALLETID